MSDRFQCCCDFPEDCGGSGVLLCDGCGGDLCVCRCGGETECYGCDACCGLAEYHDDDPAPDGSAAIGGERP